MREDSYLEMTAAIARPRMAGVPSTVVDDFEFDRTVAVIQLKGLGTRHDVVEGSAVRNRRDYGCSDLRTRTVVRIHRDYLNMSDCRTVFGLRN